MHSPHVRRFVILLLLLPLVAGAGEPATVRRDIEYAVTLEIIAVGKHGGPEFYDEKRIALVARFLSNAIRQHKP